MIAATETAAPHIVLVDDEEDLREPVAAFLAENGLDVSEADGGQALDRVLGERPARLVVLDVSMPEEDGFSIAARLRAQGRPLGIIMLTARRDVTDRIAGLEGGADDYLMKPFDPGELLARIRSVLRRIGEQPAVVPQPLPRSTRYAREFWIPSGRGSIRVPIESIDWIEAARDYALLHTRNRSHMVRLTMTSLERDLDPADMVRIHRSAFVSPPAVESVNQTGRDITVVLKSGTTVRVGQQHADNVRERLGR